MYAYKVEIADTLSLFRLIGRDLDAPWWSDHWLSFQKEKV
jgi:hypothetical protein